jgi:hypothetical protein
MKKSKKMEKGISSRGDKLPENPPPAKKQLYSEKAEKYLREGGKIEDYPDGNIKYRKK